MHTGICAPGTIDLYKPKSRHLAQDCLKLSLYGISSGILSLPPLVSGAFVLQNNLKISHIFPINLILFTSPFQFFLIQPSETVNIFDQQFQAVFWCIEKACLVHIHDNDSNWHRKQHTAYTCDLVPDEQ